ncbi:zinc finger protein 827-like [Gouania willdenowi]|uniref:Zinc finger protein 827-like n=1 Tax=Gouania willdenowi TaxID=441366 RepID=A0A8C5GIX9_GOUWI|nr:zinc finger protein 827-like [Gouania willdenowi]XP_028331108.1 zinc finger protein 827-like [Gouania willdenowi]
MKRASPPPPSFSSSSDAAKRHQPQVYGSNPIKAATSLFSPDISRKTASDLLIRLSEATQKTQMHPGSREEVEHQDEPGPALSPDGPGASPEPPPVTHTPEGNPANDTLASDLLRKLAERQEVTLEEDEDPTDVSAVVKKQPITEEVAQPTEESCIGGNKVTEQFYGRAKMADQLHLPIKVEDEIYGDDCQISSKLTDGVTLASGNFNFWMKMENNNIAGAKMADNAKVEHQFPFNAKIGERPSSAATMEDELPSGAKMENLLFSGAKMEEQFYTGAKMADQCLRAVLWQDMSVNLASTLLHQLSERVGKSSSQSMERQRQTPPIRSSPSLMVEQAPPAALLLGSRDPPHGNLSGTVADQSSGGSYFFRCHVCGFETEGRALFQGHMSEHRQWERSSFSLHCCTCELSTNQEAEMRAHASTHFQGHMGHTRAVPSVAVATQPERSSSEHRCRICQGSFPGQRELLVHIQVHRQGNRYRCDRCGHMTRTANKLVEHVRVHTGERPFACDLCPYSAKRRDSLRLHRRVKHAHVTRVMHVDNQGPSEHLQRLHTSSSSSLPLLHPSLHPSPLLPITTLLSLKPRPLSSSSSSSPSPSSKLSFLGYLGLKDR